MADISDTALYVAAAAFIAPKAVDLLTSLFKGSVARNIEAADKAAAKTETKVESLEKQIDALDRTVLQLKSDVDNHKTAMTAALGSIDGRLIALDNRVAAQGRSYEEKIAEGFKRLEVELNRKLVQVVNAADEAPPRRRARR